MPGRIEDVPPLDHASWCGRHDDAGHLDQTCRGTPAEITPASGTASDSGRLGVWLERHDEKLGRCWLHGTTSVMVEIECWEGIGATTLTPAEARAVAAMLTDAANRAEQHDRPQRL